MAIIFPWVTLGPDSVASLPANAGAAFWRLGQEDPQVWDVIRPFREQEERPDPHNFR
jgi:hypothetical protein